MVGNIWAQTRISEKIVQQFQQYYAENPREKLHIHLDKSYYLPGEDVWLSVYLVEARQLLPSYISSVVYVDLISPTDTLVSSLTLKAANGRGAGDFALPRSLPRGKYRIRAYTQWMRNFDEAFETSIQVLGPDNASPQPPGLSLDLQFMPEGGFMIAGISGKVAFRAINETGMGQAVRGKIVDDKGASVTEFESTHQGMGVVELTPQSGTAYQAVVESGGKSQEFPLPIVAEAGYALEVTPGVVATQVRVRAHPSLGNPDYILMGEVRGEIYLLLRGRLQDHEHSVAIPNNKFPAGVVRFTVFDATGLPHCERRIFNPRPEINPRLVVKGPEERVGKRSPVTLNLQLQNAKKQVLAGDVSIAVVEESSLGDFPDRSSISASFWLRSEFSDPIAFADQYFSRDHKPAEIDLVMLTHGYSKYEWKPILEGEFPETPYLIEQGLTLSGQVFNTSGKPVVRSPIQVMLGSMFNFSATETDAEGKFLFGGLDYVDSTKVMLQARNTKNKPRDYEIRLDQVPPRPISPDPFSGTIFTTSGLSALQEYGAQRLQVIDMTSTMQFELEEVEIEGRKKDLKDDPIEGALYKRADFTLKGEDLPPASFNLFEALRGRIPGLTVSGRTGNYGISLRRQLNIDTPLLLLNGTPVDALVLESIPLVEVERIDILKGARAAIYGNRGSAGALAVYTKTGSDPYGNEDIGVLRPELKGYYLSRTFYAPAYGPQDNPSELPDMRTTLYWNPQVNIDENGKATVEFYAGDISGDFQVVVEGMTVEGTPVHEEIVVTIEK